MLELLLKLIFYVIILSFRNLSLRHRLRHFLDCFRILNNVLEIGTSARGSDLFCLQLLLKLINHLRWRILSTGFRHWYALQLYCCLFGTCRLHLHLWRLSFDGSLHRCLYDLLWFCHWWLRLDNLPGIRPNVPIPKSRPLIQCIIHFCSHIIGILSSVWLRFRHSSHFLGLGRLDWLRLICYGHGTLSGSDNCFLL